MNKQPKWWNQVSGLILAGMVWLAASGAQAAISPAATVDTTTQGSWVGMYGTQGYILASFDGTAGGSGTDRTNLPAYISGYSTTGTKYVFEKGVTPRDLQDPANPSTTSARSVGCWYAASSFTVTLTPSQSGTFRLGLYYLDPLAQGRGVSWTISGANLTGTDTLPSFSTGYWYIYTLSATVGTPIVITVTKTAGPNAILNAITFDPLPGSPPTIQNGMAQNIQTNSANITGTLTSDSGISTTAYLYWATNDCTTNATAWLANGGVTNLGAYVAGTTFTNTLSGLSSNTFYYFNQLASNANGTAWASTNGSPHFRTQGATPVVDNDGGATNMTFSSATLRGTLTGGGAADVRIYLGTTEGVWSYTNDLGVLTEGAFSTNVSGLVQGTRYYYSCLASNSYGAVWAATSTNFQTQAFAAGWIGVGASGSGSDFNNTANWGGGTINGSFTNNFANANVTLSANFLSGIGLNCNLAASGLSLSLDSNTPGTPRQFQLSTTAPDGAQIYANNGTALSIGPNIQLICDGSVQGRWEANGSSTITYNCLITGNAGWNFQCVFGVQTFNNTNNTFTDHELTSYGGTIQFTSIANAGQPSALGTNGIIYGNSGNFEYIGTTACTSDRPIGMANPLGLYNDAASPSATLTLNGTVTPDSVSATTWTIAGSNTGANVISGLIQNGASTILNLTKNGVGTWRVNNNTNSFTGNVYVYGGLLEFTSIAKSNTVSSLGAGAQLQIIGYAQPGIPSFVGTGAQSSDRTVILNYGGSYARTPARLLANGPTTADTLNLSGLIYGTANTLSIFGLGGTNTGNNAISGSIVDGKDAAHGGVGTVNDTTALLKQDSGTWILSGTNYYTGATTVSNGILRVNGSIVSPVTVLTNASLAGTGLISNNVNFAAGGKLQLYAKNGVSGVLHVTGTVTAASSPVTVVANVTGGSFNGLVLTATNALPDFISADPRYKLTKQNGNTELWLNVPAAGTMVLFR